MFEKFEMLKITNLIKNFVISVILYTLIFSSIGAGMYLFNGNPILDGNLIKVDSGYCIENDDCLLFSESEKELIFNPTNKGTVSSFQSNIQMDQLDESIEFVIWSQDDIFISVDYELKKDVDKFIPLILHFDNFDNIISTSGISSERTIVFDPIEGIALFNNDTFLFIGNRVTSDEIYDMRVEDGKGYVLYVLMKNPPKKGHFIVSLKNLIKDEDVEGQFNKYSNVFKNPPSFSVGPEEYSPILIESSKKSTDTEVETKFLKSPLFIREGDTCEYEINFSSNKPVYLEGNIETRHGQEIIDQKYFENYFDKNYIYKTSIFAPNIDAMPWEKDSKLTVNLMYFYGSMGEGSNTFQTRLISNSFIRLTYLIYLIVVTITFSLIYGNYLKNMDQYPLLLLVILPTIFIIISLVLNDSTLYYSGKINLQEPFKLLIEIPISIGFLILFSMFVYQYHHSLSIKGVILLASSIPIFYINRLWLLVPIILITFEAISNFSLITSWIQKLIKK